MNVVPPVFGGENIGGRMIELVIDNVMGMYKKIKFPFFKSTGPAAPLFRGTHLSDMTLKKRKKREKSLYKRKKESHIIFFLSNIVGISGKKETYWTICGVG